MQIDRELYEIMGEENNKNTAGKSKKNKIEARSRVKTR
jgi:hypothetical protein